MRLLYKIALKGQFFKVSFQIFAGGQRQRFVNHVEAYCRAESGENIAAFDKHRIIFLSKDSTKVSGPTVQRCQLQSLAFVGVATVTTPTRAES